LVIIFFSLFGEIHVIGTEMRAQVRPNCSILEKYEPCTEPQVKLSLLRSISLKLDRRTTGATVLRESKKKNN
jgi:hypothetical protein